MTLPEFQSQLNRLIEQFGKSAYSQPRAELIWREVKDFSRFWWEKTVDHLLLTCRVPPLHPEFGPLISDERERIYKIEKQQHTQDAKDFMESAYLPDDTKTICQMITQIVIRQPPAGEVKNYVDHLTHAAEISQQEKYKMKGEQNG